LNVKSKQRNVKGGSA